MEKKERPMTHELKTWPEYFEEVFCGRKKFEVRKNDRGFNQWDILILREWNNSGQYYTGRQIHFRVSYILDGGEFGVEEGYVVMSLMPLTPGEISTT